MNIFADTLIIGSGIAGQRAALEATKYSNNVKLLTKLPVMRSHSISAEGGINSVSLPEDSILNYFIDTVKGSDYFADQDAVYKLVNYANDEISFLEEIGVNFDKHDNNLFSVNKLGGSKFSRALNSSNQIGFFIMKALLNEIKNSNIQLMENWQVLDLLVHDNQCYGVIAINTDSYLIEEFRSNTVILATGPAGIIYKNTTNSTACTGDGVAIAYRSGALLKDMEFIQFHPTSILGSNVLITERSRSVGAHLLNKNGERFMQKYAPDSLELAPRDIVTRAIINEINNKLGFYDEKFGDYIELSFKHIPVDIINEKLADVKKLAISFANTDIYTTPLKIIPAQHYMMGGIKINLNCKTSIDQLFAAGECSCPSVHGANRLGGNSLIECLVFGKIAGANAGKNKNFDYKDSINSDLLSSYKLLTRQFLQENNYCNLHDISTQLQSLMTSNVGIFRTSESLTYAINTIKSLKNQLTNPNFDSSITSTFDICKYYELINMFDVSEAISRSALMREESRGSHSRLDFPFRDDQKWLNHILIRKFGSDSQITTENVIIIDIKPDLRKY